MASTKAQAGDRSTRTYVGIGSNLDDPEQQVRRALKALATLPDTTLLRYSSLYRSLPMGPQDQPDYINAVAELETTLPALRLLGLLQAIETQQGRVRGPVKWGPRTLDLDLLVYGRAQIAKATLTVPHPGIAERVFVLYPLAEIAPGLDIPGLGPLQELLSHCPPEGLERLGHES
jgi:2-amino-4-hydroxy-6-hydroxymethyldihydropteridine diphosphokinase